MRPNDLERSLGFWAWWSNPIVGMHDDYRYRVGIPLVDDQKLDYLTLLEVRGLLELSDTPDDSLLHYPQLCALAIIDPDVLRRIIQPCAVLVLDGSILNARPQEWDENYGVKSADDIRRIITQRGDFPKPIWDWREQIVRNLQINIDAKRSIDERALLAFAFVLKQFFPAFYKRWKLCHSMAIDQNLAFLDPLPIEYTDTFLAWLKPVLEGFESWYGEQYRPLDLEIGVDFDPLDDELDQLLAGIKG